MDDRRRRVTEILRDLDFADKRQAESLLEVAYEELRALAIHFDGHDFLRIRCTVYDFDDFSRRDELKVTKLYKYPATPVDMGSSGSRRATTTAIGCVCTTRS